MSARDYIPVGTELLGEPALACPVCGREYIHPVRIECRSPGTAKGRVVISADGIAINPHCPPVHRGTQITLRFVGECGHEFDYVFRFYKGTTLVSRFMRNLPSDRTQCPPTIWRD